MNPPIFLTTVIPGIKVRARISKIRFGKNAGAYSVRGTLVHHSRSGALTPIDKKYSRTLGPFGTYDEAKEQLSTLVGRLVGLYIKTHVVKVSDSPTPFADAYNSFPDKTLLELGRKWSHHPHSTSYQNHTYFKNSVIPLLDKYGHNIQVSDVKHIEDMLIERAMTSKRGNEDLETATKSVAQYLSACNSILDNLYRFSLPGTIPHVSFNIAPIETSIAFEQIKALAPPVRIILAYVMHLYPPDKGGLVLGNAMMYYGGLRPGEAVYPSIGDIIVHDDGRFASYRVRFQHDGRPPKSSAGYRTIILPHAFVKLLQARIDYLKEQGYSDDSISSMPVVATREDPYKCAEPQMLSAFIKDIMEKCGFVETEALKLAMEYEPVYDANGVPIKDARAYILRRDWCSRLFNVCGICGDEADYMLGHENSKYKIIDDSMNLDKMRIIADSMERFVALPEASCHPEFIPIELTAKRVTRTQAPQHTSFNFSAKCKPEEVIDLSIIATCSEIQDSITILTNAANLAVYKRDPDIIDNASPIIHSHYDMAFYDMCRKKAEILIKELIDE